LGFTRMSVRGKPKVHNEMGFALMAVNLRKYTAINNENGIFSHENQRKNGCVYQAFSQFERDLIVERTKEGLKSARARGRKGGRPKVSHKNISRAMNLYHTEEYSVKDIVEMTGISKATPYRYLNQNEIKHS